MEETPSLGAPRHSSRQADPTRSSKGIWRGPSCPSFLMSWTAFLCLASQGSNVQEFLDHSETQKSFSYPQKYF